MGIVHGVLNFMTLLLTPIIVFTILPLNLIFKLIRHAKRRIFPENIAGKVVLVTGAASGIGEQIAYEYARRVARLALVDKNEPRLLSVAERAREIHSLEVLTISADVSVEDDCKRAVEATIERFGQLDHLVNNAGIGKYGLFENVSSFSELVHVTDVNFWGGVFCTHFAIPHLKKSRGKVVAIASASGWYPLPKLAIYGASKAAVISFYETLRAEMGDQIGITVVTPSIVDTELVSSAGNMAKELGFIPKISREECAKAIVKSACRGDAWLVVPFWTNALFPLKLILSELAEYLARLLIVSRFPRNSTKGKIQ